MKKKTMGVLLTILLLSVYGISVNAKKEKKGGNPFDEIWDYILSVINPTLEDHEARITALEPSEEPLEQPIRIGITSGNTYDHSPLTYAETVIFADIVAEGINQYVMNLGLDMTFEFVVKNNDFGRALYNTMLFKATGIDLIVGHPWSGQCLESLNYVNTNNMLLISGSSTSPDLAIPNDRLFRTCPHGGEFNYVFAEMWETWGVEFVLIIQDEWQWDYQNFEDELEIRGIVPLGRIPVQNCDEWEDKFAEANEILTAAIDTYGADKVGIQFLYGSEMVELQKDIVLYAPKFMDVIWMTTERGTDSMLDDEQFGALAVQTRHFSPFMTVDETSIPYQEFVDKYYALTDEMPHYYITVQYDACWLLAETIIATGSADAGVIADNLIPISGSFYGLSGCLALDENGDRIPELYDISGFYEDTEYKVGIFGSYDSSTTEVNWDDIFLEETGITRPGK